MALSKRSMISPWFIGNSSKHSMMPRMSLGAIKKGRACLAHSIILRGVLKPSAPQGFRERKPRCHRLSRGSKLAFISPFLKELNILFPFVVSPVARRELLA